MATEARRSILKAGAVAIGAALLPRAGSASTEPSRIERLRSDYRQRIEEIAAELRPGFEAGTFRGYNDEDSERWDDAIEAGTAWNGGFRPPMDRLEDEIADRLLGRQVRRQGDGAEVDAAGVRQASWVLLCSPSAAAVVDDGATIEGMAVGAATRDVLRIARERRWYVVTPGECPTNEELGVRS